MIEAMRETRQREAEIIVLRQRVAELEEENQEQARRIVRLETKNRELGEEVDRLLSITRSSMTVRARQRERMIETGGMATVEPGRAQRRPSAAAPPKMKLTA